MMSEKKQNRRRTGDRAPSRYATAQGAEAELLLIHPFREGNGRLARWVSELMAFQAGLPSPDYGFVGRGAGRRRTTYLEAVKRGYLQDYESLTVFFAEALERRLRTNLGD